MFQKKPGGILRGGKWSVPIYICSRPPPEPTFSAKKANLCEGFQLKMLCFQKKVTVSYNLFCQRECHLYSSETGFGECRTGQDALQKHTRKHWCASLHHRQLLDKCLLPDTDKVADNKFRSMLLWMQERSWLPVAFPLWTLKSHDRKHECPLQILAWQEDIDLGISICKATSICRHTDALFSHVGNEADTRCPWHASSVISGASSSCLTSSSVSYTHLTLPTKLEV